ncbi:hypothetical protein LWI28_007627 [Acer negundo]|uniref:Embryo defective 2759 n=1 Tax=Acer negundo TaxID=4023 RepID=A0AAD5NPW1_ACENE|nr:hypothetical protein LWI28_007627 [Acer negundo]
MTSIPQGSYVTFPSRSLSLSRGLTLRRHVTTVHVVGKKEWCLSLKRNFCLSVGSPNVCGVRVKPVKISAFKGSAQNNESGGRASGSKISKNSVKLSYIPKDRSPAIHQLFKKWLTMLRTQSPSQVVTEDLGEELTAREEVPETHIEIPKKGRGDVLKAFWCHFWDLDATIKIPLMIFVPMYLAVNMIYGTGVSKELTPLWVFGPLIVALYVKMFQWLYALYVFSFKQTVKVVTNLPTYCLLAYNYIAQGKLIDEVGSRVWQPVADVKNLGFKELSRRKMKEFQEWIGEQYLDFVESIWPYYCRTIRFLKRANLI